MQINEKISYGRVDRVVQQLCYRHLFYIFAISDIWENEQ